MAWPVTSAHSQTLLTPHQKVVKREFLKLLDLYILIVFFKSENFKELLTT